VSEEIDSDILQMDQEDMVDEIMTLRAALKSAKAECAGLQEALNDAELEAEGLSNELNATHRVTGFKRVAVMDNATCETCRERDGSLILDVGELTRDCTQAAGCRCAAVPIGRVK
jgi:hypothetical protein